MNDNTFGDIPASQSVVKRRCEKCNSIEKIEKHSLVGNHKAPFQLLCRKCHDEVHGHTPKRDMKSILKRRIRRAERRIARDREIIEDSREQLAEIRIKTKIEKAYARASMKGSSLGRTEK